MIVGQWVALGLCVLAVVAPVTLDGAHDSADNQQILWESTLSKPFIECSNMLHFTPASPSALVVDDSLSSGGRLSQPTSSGLSEAKNLSVNSCSLLSIKWTSTPKEKTTDFVLLDENTRIKRSGPQTLSPGPTGQPVPAG